VAMLSIPCTYLSQYFNSKLVLSEKQVVPDDFRWVGHSKNAETKDFLILFYDKKKPLLKASEMEQIKGLAAELNLNFLVKESTYGLPAEIKTLPAIIFQNKKGRSQYFGRYTNLPRIRNFVRTSKMMHPKNSTRKVKNVFLWKKGKADITAPIKITSLTGLQPEPFDSLAFKRELKESLASGMEKFQLESAHEASKSTKSFYFNIYPYLDEDRKMHITYEIFSQYNCIEAISQKLDSVLTPFDWEARAKGFQQIGSLIEKDIFKHISDSNKGDAFSTVPDTSPIVSWVDLGLDIRASTKQLNEVSKLPFSIEKHWKVEKNSTKDDPLGVFSFLSPLDNYAGEIKDLNGSLQLHKSGSLQKMSGAFKVKVEDITMGAKGLDDQIRTKILQQALFPIASFEFSDIACDKDQIKMGDEKQIEIPGTFTMLGISIPLVVEANLLPTYEQGLQKLSVSCTFHLSLFESFKIEGPDGPSPAKDHLRFFMKFNLIEST